MTSFTGTLQLFFTEAAGQTTPSQRPHRHRLPRRCPAPAAFRAGSHQQAPSTLDWTMSTPRRSPRS